MSGSMLRWPAEFPGWQALWQGLRRGWKVHLQPRQRQLRLEETLSLGEKRFVAVLNFGGQRFLIGGASQSVALLTRLPSFEEALLRVKPEGRVA